MEKTIITCYDEFEKLKGEEIGVSDWFEITQERINQFAEATNDHQWIHTDPERAKVESPFKSTIAHGYLTLSMLPFLWEQIVEVQNLKLMVNYGIDKFKFNQAVLVNNKIRLRAKLHEIANLRGVCKATIKISMEIEGSRKSAFDGLVTFLYHFNN